MQFLIVINENVFVLIGCQCNRVPFPKMKHIFLPLLW